MGYIYGLTDPRTKEIRYIGLTSQEPKYRYGTHVNKARRGKDTSAKGAWLHALISEGLKPGLEIIEQLENTALPEAEAYWVSYYLEQGCKLLNMQEPGKHLGSRGNKVQWTVELESRLGTVSDAFLAAELGCTRKSVAYRREKLGIPAYEQKEHVTSGLELGRGHNAITLPDACIAELGTAPDYILAANYGVSKYTIARHRRATGIDSYAATSGNTGRFFVGMQHPRWKKGGSPPDECN